MCDDDDDGDNGEDDDADYGEEDNDGDDKEDDDDCEGDYDGKEEGKVMISRRRMITRDWIPRQWPQLAAVGRVKAFSRATTIWWPLKILDDKNDDRRLLKQ